MKKIIYISVGINIILLFIISYAIYEKGGVSYLKLKLNPPIESLHYDNVFYLTKKSIFEIMPNDTNGIIFVGNSITSNIDWHELFSNPKIINRGIGDDVVVGVIARLPEIVRLKPKQIFLMIGTNDLAKNISVNQLLINYEKLVSQIKEKSPQTKLYIESILPIHDILNRNNDDIIAANLGIKSISEKHGCTYVNLFDLLKTEKNELDTAYTFDGLHLNGKGYLIWKKAVEMYIGN